MPATFTESIVEEAALAWFAMLRYDVRAGAEIAPDQPNAERADYSQVVLEGRLRQALERLNPQVPSDAIEEAFRKLTRADAPSLIAANRIIHKYLVDGVPVEFQRTDGSLGGDLVRVIDFDDIDNNEFQGTYFAKQQSLAAAGDRRVGVVWHTQGSGKSLTMAFYAGRVVLHPAMQNPTLVIITDRNDLDDQLFGTFAKCHELLRQQPVQASNRSNLRDLLQTGSGGVIFTTIHKFFPTSGEDHHPLLSDRRNIVVIADEAHRSQYDFIDGFARHMREALPNASFIGFTGTPIELADANTRSVFGDYISVYDIERAVKDGATVPIYYESRLAKLSLEPDERPKLDAEFEEATEGEEVDHKEKLKTKWAALEALVGAEKRVALIATDLVNHFERRLEAMDGKAMVVCMSRRICVDLYNAIIKLRPDWHHDDDDKGIIKIIMTGSAADPPEWQPHVRSKSRREELAKRFKNAKDSFKIVIVRDMWLTGFDAPCLHTMYADKPMRGHGLMQAIARVNRVFKDKPGGLIVDYLGLAHELKQALLLYHFGLVLGPVSLALSLLRRSPTASG